MGDDRNLLGAIMGRGRYLTMVEAGALVGKSGEAFRVWAKRRRLELRRVGCQLFIWECDFDAALELYVVDHERRPLSRTHAQ